MIHPTAIVENGAQVADGVEIGPYAIVEKGAIVGSGCILAAGAIIRSGTRLAENVRVDSYSVIGGIPQDLHFDPKTKSGVEVGAGTVIREHVTVHCATSEGGVTKVGAKCLLMATCHIAHDCTVGDGVVIANGVMLAGHVEIGDGAVVGGNSAIHQFVRVGTHVMLSGQSAFTRDVPPYCLAALRDHLAGLNLVGLRRSGFTREEIAELKELFHLVFDNGGSPRDNAAAIPADKILYDCGRLFVDFFKTGKRGFLRKFDDKGVDE